MTARTGSRLTLEITAELDRQRLDKALATLAVLQEPGLSRARVQALLAAGHLFLDKTPVTDASKKVNAGDVYTLVLPPPEKAEPEAQKMKLTIVYEDDDVIVIDKPVGLVVHPAPGNRDKTLVNALLAHCGDSLSGIGGVARPGIVHRLDKDTSGLIVVAKHDAAHHALAAQFADRSLSRTYHALVWGVPTAPKGSIEAPIGRSAKDRKKMAVMTKGKPALTHYRVIENFGVASLVECTLATGRTHQIRVHMAHIKHPLVGDKNYGGRFFRVAKNKTTRDNYADSLREFPRQALHAVGLKFIHPRTGKSVKFSSKLPQDMRELIEGLE
jgi:23S rRNA pseudouridine1911/1915/1917 synthase